MKKLICIMGKTFSGKTTLVKRLKKEEKLDFVLSHTTRPPRQNETDAVDYHFDNYVAPNALALRTYHPDGSMSSTDWSYWFNASDIEEANNPVIVIDYQGFLDIKKALPQYHVVALYLQTPLSVLLKRITTTINNENKLSEAIRRLSSDNVAFSRIITNEYVLKNHKGIPLFIQNNDVVLVDWEKVSQLTSTALLAV